MVDRGKLQRIRGDDRKIREFILMSGADNISNVRIDERVVMNGIEFGIGQKQLITFGNNIIVVECFCLVAMGKQIADFADLENVREFRVLCGKGRKGQVF